MSSFTLNPIASLPVVLGVIAVLVAVFLIRPDFRSASPGRRRWLLLLRLGIAILVATLMVRPGCRTTVEKSQTATVMIFCDVSRSMRLPHESGGLSRWDRMKAALKENEDRLKRLNDRLDLRFYSLDGHAIPLDFENGSLNLPNQPDAGQTDMGTVLHEGIADHQSERLAAVFMLTDGTQNADDPEYEIADAVAELDQLQVPLFPVALGLPRDAGQAADVGVVGLADQFSIFVKNRLAVQATIKLTGFANQQIPVQLIVTDRDGNETVVDTQMVEATKPDQTLPITLSYAPEESGQYMLTVQAEEQPRELVTQNNRLPAFLTVHEGGLRVLYLEGYIRPEIRFLRQSLAASQDIELDFQLLDQRNQERWPVDLTSTLRSAEYDVIVIGDLDSNAIYQAGDGEETVAEILKMVTERGKGLLFLGGYHSFGPGRYHTTPLADIMPIRMQRFEAQDFGTEINHDLHIERPLTIRPTVPQFITNLVPGQRNQAAWEGLPPLLGANRFLGVKDRSIVLLESRQQDPILIIGNYGGRVAAFAGDTTWQWWMDGQQELHKRFWRQMILWLAKLDGLSDDNVWIDLPQRRFSPGTTVSFATGAKTATGEAIENANIDATLIRPNGERVSISTFAEGGFESGTLEKETTSGPGTYTIEVSASDGTTLLGTSRAEFIVFDEDREQSNPAADPELLASMASQTKSWGGQMIRPEELGEKLDQLQDLPLELIIEVPQKWEIGGTLGDALAFIFFFAGLLGIEWLLRKKWAMV